jgi:uncharacterized protein (DUF305 family)
MAALALAAAGFACQREVPAPQAAQTTTVQPGAPGEASTVRPAQPASPSTAHTDADTAFMQGMIHHHAQALEMVDLLTSRTERPDLRLLGDRIRISQNDEIKMMKGWLADRHEAVPVEHPDHTMTMPMAGMANMPMAMPPMPGMLTADQMTALARANGSTFDRLFLTGMIQHHSGAITMVADLFKSPGAAQDSVLFDFATHVDADQRMEIARMRHMLDATRNP